MFRAWPIGLVAILLIAAGPLPRSIQTPQPRTDHETQSQPPAATHQENTSAQKPPTTARVIVLNADEIAKKAARYQREQQEQAPPDWWSRSGVIAAIIIGILQTFVFGYQAFKLRQTVRDGEASIKAATKAASAAARQASVAETAIRSFEMPQIVLDLHEIRVNRRGTKVPLAVSRTGVIEEFYVEFMIRNVGRSAAESLLVRTVLSKEDEVTSPKQDHYIGSLAAGEPSKPIIATKAKEWPHTWFQEVWERAKYLKLRVTFEYVDRLNQSVVISQPYIYVPKRRCFQFDGVGTRTVSNEYAPQGE